jgi:hypothetical protein
MATINSERQGGLTASADLSAKQYCFAVVSGDRTVTFAGTAGLLCAGVIENKPLLGQAVSLLVGPEIKVVASATITAGQKISTTNAGTAKVAVTGETILGQAIEGATVGAIFAATFEPGAIAP